MKTSKLYFFVIAFLAISISMVSCSGDDGEAGLLGPKGDKGEQGVAGEVGPAGTDGSIIYSGEGEPAATVGAVSDYYLDVATGMLYGPKKNADNWTDTDGFSLKGTDGTNGTDGVDGTDGTNGSKTLSGEGVPDSSIGTAGDYYLDKENMALYGPKASVVVFGSPESAWWGAGLELKGADGNANVKTFKLSVTGEEWEIDNVAGANKKLGAYDLELQSLTEDVFENGIVLVYYVNTSGSNFANLYLLPKTEVTPKNNTKFHRFYVQKTGDNYHVWIKQELSSYNDTSELLTFKEETEYQIKIITGQAAVQLQANRDNKLEFERLVNLVD